MPSRVVGGSSMMVRGSSTVPVGLQWWKEEGHQVC